MMATNTGEEEGGEGGGGFALLLLWAVGVGVGWEPAARQWRVPHHHRAAEGCDQPVQITSERRRTDRAVIYLLLLNTLFEALIMGSVRRVRACLWLVGEDDD